jgi:protein ImuB
MFACIHAPGLADVEASRLEECARDFSPGIERTSSTAVVLNAGGLRTLFGSAKSLADSIARRATEAGLHVHVALARNPDAAVHAARGIPGVTVIPPGREAGILSPLPVDILEPAPAMAETLHTWGIHTFGQLAALPENGIAERLGAEGVRLQKLARGEGSRSLAVIQAAPVFEEAVELEYPLTLLEPLSFILGRFLNDICARLESHGMATHEVCLVLMLEGGSEHVRVLRLPFPMRSGATFLKLLKLDLEGHPPDAPIVGVKLTAEPVNPRVVQAGLFVPLEPEPQKLELTLARIAKVVGGENVGCPELLNTHRPGAFRLRRWGQTWGQTANSNGRNWCLSPGLPHLALRIFRPPLDARVKAPDGRPVQIAARGIQGNVIASAGPWRTSGDWWKTDGWSRDEWDVALSDGALYRICLDRVTGGWLVEGSYD